MEIGYRTKEGISMNILAPINTIESVKLVIEAGADEIYLGADEGIFNTYSFTGRGKVSYGNLRVLPSYDDFRNIVIYAHQCGLKINYIANLPYLHNGTFQGSKIEKEYLKYVERGLELEVDSIVVGDLGLLQSIKDHGYKINIHASIYFKTLNSYQLNFLSEFGVTRTCLSYHVTLDEIKQLVSADIMDIEVVGYLGCSFFNGACGFLHELGEGVYNDFDPGIACKNIYTIKDDNELDKVSFDVEMGCALCSLGILENAGVKALKIVGRDRSCKQMADIVNLYKRTLQLFREDADMGIPNPFIDAWWKKVWCSKNKCKYKENAISKYMVN